MKITEINWHIFGDDGDRVKAVASVVFDNQLVVHEVKVVQGDKRVFVAYPNRNYIHGDKKGAVYPISNLCREAWEKEILASYNQHKGGKRE